MSIFGKKKQYPGLPEGDYDLVLRCSICNGEQVVCTKDKATGELQELYMVTDQDDLERFCEANGIQAEMIKKVY
ncbi:MAG: aspartate dehydrogenase [Eubacterium sp.]|nr:aspartate dehydrogenase [Eubacterium sp.]